MRTHTPPDPSRVTHDVTARGIHVFGHTTVAFYAELFTTAELCAMHDRWLKHRVRQIDHEGREYADSALRFLEAAIAEQAVEEEVSHDGMVQDR